MRFHSVLISSILLASAVLAGNYNNRVLGGVTMQSPSNGTFHNVTASFIVPSVSGEPTDAVSAFVALDDPECPAVIQVGINLEVNFDPNQQPRIYAWYETPDPGTFDSFSINVGDNITFLVAAPYDEGPTSVFVMLHNTNTGQTVTTVLKGEYEPCGKGVQWIVSNVPFTGETNSFHDICNFGTLKFTGVSATGPTGQVHWPQDKIAQVYDMVYDNYTTVAITRVPVEDSIEITYVF